MYMRCSARGRQYLYLHVGKRDLFFLLGAVHKPQRIGQGRGIAPEKIGPAIAIKIGGGVEIPAVASSIGWGIENEPAGLLQVTHDPDAGVVGERIVPDNVGAAIAGDV